MVKKATRTRPHTARGKAAGLGDAELVRRAQQKDEGAFREIMQRHNQRLYRVARGVLGNDSEAEDVVQESYLRAFANLAGFRGESSLVTWLTRIVVNEAVGRLRQRRPTVGLEVLDSENTTMSHVIPFPTANIDPERVAAQREIRRMLERAIDELPQAFRSVFVMRVVEDMSIEETASLLSLREETVKTRLHRARKLLQQALDERLKPALMDTFPFDGARCERMTQRVLLRLGFAAS